VFRQNRDYRARAKRQLDDGRAPLPLRHIADPDGFGEVVTHGYELPRRMPCARHLPGYRPSGIAAKRKFGQQKTRRVGGFR